MSTDFAYGVQPSSVSQLAKEWVEVNSAKFLPQANKRRRSHDRGEWVATSDINLVVRQQSIAYLDDIHSISVLLKKLNETRHETRVDLMFVDACMSSNLPRPQLLQGDALWHDPIDENALNRIRLLSRYVSGEIEDVSPVTLKMSSILMSPAFSFAVSGIAATISAVLLATGNYWPLMAFGVGAVSFAFLGILKLTIDRAVASGLPK